MQEKKSKAIKHIKVTLSAFCLFLEQHCQALIHTSDFPQVKTSFFLKPGTRNPLPDFRPLFSLLGIVFPRLGAGCSRRLGPAAARTKAQWSKIMGNDSTVSINAELICFVIWPLRFWHILPIISAPIINL